MEQNDDNPTPLTADGIDARTVFNRLFYVPNATDYSDYVTECDLSACVITQDDDGVWVFKAFDGRWIAGVGNYHTSRLSAMRVQLDRLHWMAEKCKAQLAEIEARARAVALQVVRLDAR